MTESRPIIYVRYRDCVLFKNTDHASTNQPYERQSVGCTKKSRSNMDSLGKKAAEYIRAWGMDPDQILTKKAVAQPHRIFISPPEREQIEIQQLNYALRKAIMKELLKAQRKNGINSHQEDGSSG